MQKPVQKEAPRRLASPEQLDRLLVIIRVPGWIALGCLALLTLLIVLWSVFGRIPLTVEAKGIFFNPESIELIQSELKGFVQDIKVLQGDQVKAGDALLVVSDPEQKRTYSELKERIDHLQANLEQERKNNLKAYSIELEQHRAIYDLQQKRKRELEGLPQQQEELYTLEVQMREQEFAIALLEEKMAQADYYPPLDALRTQLRELKQRAHLLTLQQEKLTIKAPDAGRILTIEVLKGQEVQPGQNLMWFQKRTEKEESLLVYSFFPIRSGDQIKPGMRAHIQFNILQSETYGKMVGTVKKVLPFAATVKGSILQSIPSEELRKYLVEKESFIVVEIEPTPDLKTASGYRWTTSKGPPFKILGGSVTQVEVFLSEKRPISYLIPLEAE